jgi:hypothetical protein
MVKNGSWLMGSDLKKEYQSSPVTVVLLFGNEEDAFVDSFGSVHGKPWVKGSLHSSGVTYPQIQASVPQAVSSRR